MSTTPQIEEPLSRDITTHPAHIEAARILMMMSRSYYNDLTAGRDSSSVSKTSSPGGHTTDVTSPTAPGSSSGYDVPSRSDSPDPGSPPITDNSIDSDDVTSSKQVSPGRKSLPFLSRINGRYISTSAFTRSLPIPSIKSDERVESSILATPDTTILATEKAEVEAEIQMHNQRVQDFLALKANPTYTPAAKHRFIREWLQSFCHQRATQGHAKLFTCASHLIDNKPCTTGQEHGASSLSRPCIATFFGHNKLEWLQVPTSYRVVLCRKHYQTGAYRGLKHHSPADPQSFPSLQLKLLRAQVGKIAEWRPLATFTVQPTAAMRSRIAAYHKLVSQGVACSDAAEEVDGVCRDASLSREVKHEERTGVEFALEFDGIYGKHGVDFQGMLEIFDYLEERLKSGHLRNLPAVEFLLQVRPEDRAREAESRRLRLEREREKVALPEELKPARRLVKVKQEEVDEEEGEEEEEVKKPGTLFLVKRKGAGLEGATESKKGKID